MTLFRSLSLPLSVNFCRYQEHLFLRASTTLRQGCSSRNDSNTVYLQRGVVYTIPFEFQLPTSLPSSTQYPTTTTKKNTRKEGKVYNCRIQVCTISLCLCLYSFGWKLSLVICWNVSLFHILQLPRLVKLNRIQPLSLFLLSFKFLSKYSTL